MGDKEFQAKRGIGSVRAAISRYGGKGNQGTGLESKFQKDATDSEEGGSKAQELHIAKTTFEKINQNTRLAETVKSQAEFELLMAKRTVRDLTAQIERLKLKAKQKTEEHQAVPVLKRADNQSAQIPDMENHQYKEIMRELEIMKREVSKIKLDIARALEENFRAEKEAEAAGLRLRSYMNTAEKLRREIDEANEEEVLVELAQIQARKELAEIEHQKKEEADNFSSKMQEYKKNKKVLKNEIEQLKQLKDILAITNSEADVLQNELKLIKEMDERIANSSNAQSKSPEVQPVEKDLEAARKTHASIKAQVFQVMAGMDTVRIELNNIVKEKEQMEKMEAKTEKYIKKLNSKLLRSKDKLEAATASEENARSMLPSFTISLQELEKVKEAVEEEKKSIIEETASIRDDIQKTEATTVSTEDRLLAAIQELEAVTAAEASAFKKLKTLAESAVVSRASKYTDIITVSKFEYDYLSGSAMAAEKLADKKVAAARAWSDALRANAKEMQIKTALAKGEMKELRLKEEEFNKMEISAHGSSIAELEIPKQRDPDNSSVTGRTSMTEDSYNLTTPRKTTFRKSVSSPAARRPIISTSLTLKRKKKGVRKFANYFSNPQTATENTVSPEESQ